MSVRQTQCGCRDCLRAIKRQASDGREVCAGCQKAGCDGDGRDACQRADFVAPNTGGSGYPACGCRDCFDVAISSDVHKHGLCCACREAGCDGDGIGGCRRPPEEPEGDDA